jgi:hypothetical protein
MNAFNPGDLVMFTLGRASYIGTVQPDTSGAHDYIIETPSGTRWYVGPDELTLLPAGTPLFRAGQQVRVADDAPFHPGAAASIGGPEFRGVLFGYRLHLGDGSATGWAPAGALKPMVGELR